MAQSKQIYVRSDKDLIYFYPQHPLTDGTCISDGSLFYVIATTAAKQGFRMCMENARLIKSGNDSTFRIEYLPGLQYEIIYHLAEDENHHTPLKKDNMVLTSLLNGSTALHKDLVRIAIYKERGEGLIYEKTYCIKD